MADTLDGMLMPNLTVTDMAKSRRFYTEGLGFEEIYKSEKDDGSIQYVVLKAGNAMLGIGQDDFKKGRDRHKGQGLRIWISTTQDVSAVAARAKASGIALDSEPEKLEWGPVAFALTDPDGFKLTISEPMM
ncbi:MAG TPA: VOC family protein [Gemmatimonadales bacterium]|nr:VOC family protein [Gemmatimonadales bacterium]